jgi:hypothetical protein
MQQALYRVFSVCCGAEEGIFEANRVFFPDAFTHQAIAWLYILYKQGGIRSLLLKFSTPLF